MPLIDLASAPAVRFPLVAVDIGNTRLKLALWPARPQVAPGREAPAPVAPLALRPGDWDTLLAWLREHAPSGIPWHLASVQRRYLADLVQFLGDHRPEDPMLLLNHELLPLKVKLPRPDHVGIDRLLTALAARQLAPQGEPLVVVDLGTAITVDYVSAAGEFCGGAILPGVAMSARALEHFTDLLPLVPMEQLDQPPEALGTETVSAIRSGLYWGAVGAVRELIARLSPPGERVRVVLTGGAAPAVAQLLDPGARCEPHLSVLGIALAAAFWQGRGASSAGGPLPE